MLKKFYIIYNCKSSGRSRLFFFNQKNLLKPKF